MSFQQATMPKRRITSCPILGTKVARHEIMPMKIPHCHQANDPAQSSGKHNVAQMNRMVWGNFYYRPTGIEDP